MHRLVESVGPRRVVAFFNAHHCGSSFVWSVLLTASLSRRSHVLRVRKNEAVPVAKDKESSCSHEISANLGDSLHDNQSSSVSSGDANIFIQIEHIDMATKWLFELQAKAIGVIQAYIHA